MTKSRIDKLTDTIDRYVDKIHFGAVYDSKLLIDILKALLLLENIKKVQGSTSQFDQMNEKDLLEKLEGLM